MSGLLDQREQLQLLQQEDPPQPPPGAGFFSGSLTAGFEGLAAGAVKATAPLAAETTDQDFNPLLGALGGGLPEEYTPPVGPTMTDAEFEQQRRKSVADTLAAFRPDPTTTGFAGQLLFGITDIGSRFVAGNVLAGPFGGAALAGGTEGYAVTQEQIAAGVDPETARTVGIVQGGAAAVGGLLPVGFGVTTAGKIATGAALNVVTGAVSRGTSAYVLESGGYTKQAEQYKWLDAQALITDAVLGAGFGWTASPHAQAMANRLFGEGGKPTPEQVAAAAVAQQQLHAEIDTAPGITIDTAARDAHADNLVRATEALLSDDPVPTLRDVTVLPNPEAQAFRREMERAAETPVERRANPELRARIDEMTPEQRDAELKWLREEHDRLNNELRTDPLTGLGNKRAWAEIEANPALPVKAMLDVDSLKWVNDNLGHEAGDAYLTQIGEAIKRSGVENVARLGGDEFAFAARTPEAADAAAARVNEELAAVRVEATTPDGQVITKTGAGVSYGRGATRGEADAGLYRNKADRTAQGLRSERGAEPAGVSRQPATPRAAMVSDMQFRPESIDRAVSQMLDDGSEVFGLRVDEGRDLKDAEAVPPSRVWEDSEPTAKMLDGASAVQLRKLNAQGINDAIQRLKRGGYFGDSIYLIGGEKRGSGEDAGEVVIGNARVVAKLERSDAAAVPKQPAPGKQSPVPAAGAEGGAGRPAAPDDGTPVNQAARAAEDVGAAAADESAAVVLAEQPDLKMVLDDGREASAAEVLAEADAELAQAQAEANLYNVAVSCFLSNGA